MKAIKINNEIIRLDAIPLTLKEVRPKCLNYRGLSNEEHYADGIRDYVLPTLLENQKLGEDYFDEDNDVFTSYVVDLTQEEIDVNLIQAQKDIFNTEHQLYLKRQSDGIYEYMKISAEFRLAKLSGVIDEATHSFIEDELKVVRDEITLGQWKEGLKQLEQLGSVGIGQELYDRLHLQIADYITENY